MEFLRPIYEYQSTRDYLNAVRAHYFGPKRGITLAQWSRKLGYRSPRSVSHFLEGRRIPNFEFVKSFSRDRALTLKEEKYFQLLVERERRSKRGEPPQRVHEGIEKELELFRKKPVSRNTVVPESLQFLSNWYALVIKQLVESPDFCESPKWVSGRLRGKVSEEEVKICLENLLRAGMIQRNVETGRLESCGSLLTSNDAPSRSIRTHHEQMLERAREALHEQRISERVLTSVTLRISKEDEADARKFIFGFMKEFNLRFSSDESNRVCQLNVQFFKHTESRDGA